MTDTHLIIFNREQLPAGATGWIHVVPKGELPNRAAGVVQVLDDESLDAILANIASERSRLGDKWPGIYAGREHFIYNDEQDSAALAWFKDFEKRADGIWAKADGLTPIGKQVIANAEYKFTSFVADRKDTQKLDGNKIRILKLDTIGFTNQANGKELLTPITNRSMLFNYDASQPRDENGQWTEEANAATSIASKELATMPNAPDWKHRAAGRQYEASQKHKLAASKYSQGDFMRSYHEKFSAQHERRMNNILDDKPIENRSTNLPVSREPGASPNNKNERTKTMKNIAAKLGLAPEASEEAILGEVTKLQNRITTLEPLDAENTTLKNRVAEVEGDACESLLDGCGIKKDDKRRAHLVSSLKVLKNREERLAHLLDFDIKPVEGKETKVQQSRVLNRGEGKPATTQTATVDAAEQSSFVESIRVKNRCTFAEAWDQAKREKPELFPAAN